MAEKRINKILWHGDALNDDGTSMAPPLPSAGGDGTDGINPGEVYISDADEDPALFIRTNKDRVARISGSGDSKNYTRQEIDELLKKKVDNAFFSKLFALMGGEGSEIAVNDTDTEAKDIQAKLGLWTNSYLSALGKNEDAGGSGGGTGGAGLLSELGDVSLGTLEAGQSLVWNGSQWTNRAVESGLDYDALRDYLTSNKYITESTLNASLSGYVKSEDLNSALSKKVDVAFFSRLFGLISNSGSEIVVNDVETAAASIRAKLGLWTQEYLSALGDNDGGSGGGGASYDRLDSWEDYSTSKSGWVLSAALGYDLLGRVESLENKSVTLSVTGSGNGLSGFTQNGNNVVFTKASFLVSSDLNGYATQSWVNGVLSDYVTATSLSTTLQGYVTKSALSETLSKYYTSSEVDAKLSQKVDTAFFAKLLAAIAGDGTEIAVNDMTTAIASIKAKFGLWSESYISTLGNNGSGGSGGGGVSYDRLDAWGDYDTGKSGWVLSAGLGYDLYTRVTAIQGAGYATQAWVTGQGYAKVSDLDARIDALVNGAPAAYDTLKEIADVLQGNVDSIGDILTTLGTKADKTVSIVAGTGLTGGGDLSANRTIALATVGTAGTYTKVTVDAYGRVTGHASLAAGDIPALDWSKITSGKPTTLAGYGITDAYTKTQGDARYAYVGGTNATGTWPIGISGNAATATNADKLDGYHISNIETGGWTSLITYVYDETNGTRYYSHRIGNLNNTGDVILRVRITEDINYPSYSEWTLRMNFVSGYGRCVSLVPNTPCERTLYVYVDASNYLWIRCNATWNCTMEYKIERSTGSILITSGVTKVENAPADISYTITNFGSKRNGTDSKSYNHWSTTYNATTSVKIGGGTITWDATNNCFHFSHGLYSDDFISTMGKNPDAGGTPVGITELSKLSDVTLTSPSSGQVLQYNGNKWVNATLDLGASSWDEIEGKPSWIGSTKPSYTWSDIIDKPSVFATDIASISDLHASWDALLKAAPTAYVTRWPTFAEVTGKPTTLSGYGITDGVNAVSVTGSGNAVTSAAISGHTLTLTKGSTFLLSSSYTAADVLAKLKTVDGRGSGLDADLLDGHHNGDITAIRLDGIYTGNGGTQQPSYFAGRGKGIFLNMMSVPAQYSDVIYIDAYGGMDVPYVNAIAFQKTSAEHGTVYHARAAHNGSAWGTWYPFIDSYNIGSYNAGSATKLQTARTLWGQTFDGTANVSGNMTGVGSITMSGQLTVNTSSAYPAILDSTDSIQTYLRVRRNGTDKAAFGYYDGKGAFMYSFACIKYLQITDAGALTFDGNVGIGITPPSYKLHVAGTGYFSGAVTMASTLGVTGLITASAGITTPQYVQIGSGRIKWDSTNNALYIEKSDGTAIGFYTKGYISALGSNSDAGGSVVGVTSLSKLDDVSLGGLSAGQILSYNGTKWTNVAMPSVGATSLSGLTDLNSSWISLLQSAPSAYVTRWPTAAEVGALTQATADGRYALTTGTNATGTWPVSITGNAATATKLNSRGNLTALTGHSMGEAGFNLYQVYNNGYPVAYGNVLHARGMGAGELLMAWSGTDGGYAGLYYRNHRDNETSANWSDWVTVLDSSNYTTYTVTKTGGGASGTWPISISGSAVSVGGVYTTKTLSKNDNGGSPTYLLVSDITTWYNSDTYDVIHGFRGMICGMRAGNRNGDGVCIMEATAAYRKGFQRLYVDRQIGVYPVIVSYNSRYYIALYCTGSAFIMYLYGQFYNWIDSPTQLLNSNGVTVIYNYSGYGIYGNATTASKWSTARTITLTGAVTGSVSIDGSGNVSMATTYATGNISALDSRYVNVTGDTMSGALNFANNTWNKVGDDVYIGDINVAGQLGIKAANTTNPGIAFYNNSNSAVGNLVANGTTLQWRGSTLWHAGNDGSGSGLDADLLDGRQSTSYAIMYSNSFNTDPTAKDVTSTSITDFLTRLNYSGLLNSCFGMARGSWYYVGNTQFNTGVGTLEMAGTAVLNMSRDANTTADYKTLLFLDHSGYMYSYVSEESGVATWSRYLKSTENAVSATKLQTARTLWGQSFNGTANVSGNMTGVGSITASGTFSTSNSTVLQFTNYTNKNIITWEWTSTYGDAVNFYIPGTNNQSINMKLYSNGGLLLNGLLHATRGIYSDSYVSALGQNTSSDLRLKTKLSDITLSPQAIAAAPSMLFAWKQNGMKDVGSSAQYWKNILPDAVKERDGWLEMAYGNIALVSAISLAKHVVNHEERIRRLEQENARLRRILRQQKINV